MSNFIEHIKTAFQRYNLMVNFVEDGDTKSYRIMQSSALSISIVTSIITNAIDTNIGYCPIYSPRHDSNIEFTVVPYRRNVSFEVVEAPMKTITKAELLTVIETADKLTKNSLFGSIETDIVYQNLNSILVDFIATPVTDDKKALDLGCGGGSDTLYLLKKKYQVVALDIWSKALEALKSDAVKVNPDYLKDGRLTIIQSNLMTYDIGVNEYDLINCSNVLPYIPPGKLHEEIS